jgi:Reverse transcriptase (RNA-dependent DNA polymerase)
VIVTRFADDFVVGFEDRGDAERFHADLRDRFASFGLALHEEKTRLIEFGRYAAERRRARGLPKPETFDFLGFTHICARTRETGWFALRRVTSKKRLRAKLRESEPSCCDAETSPSPSKANGWEASCAGTATTTQCPATAKRSPRSVIRRHDTGEWRFGAAASAPA